MNSEIERSKEKDHKPLQNAGRKSYGDQPSLRPSGERNDATALESKNLVNLNYAYPKEADPREQTDEPASADFERVVIENEEPLYAQTDHKAAKKIKKQEQDRKLLGSDRWLVRNGHLLTYFGLYLFSILVLFRPYELVPALGFLSATAFYFALATLMIFVPSQLATEGNLTMLSTEVKAILAMTFITLLTMPIAKDPGMAWETFNDSFVKAVIIFIVLVNVVRTRKRLMGMMWLSFGIALYLSFTALDLYLKGEFNVEDYRIKVDVGGMFGNPNEMAMHLVMMTPLVITLGIAAKNKLMRFVYFALAALFVGANMVTYSRGGFLGMIVCLAVLAWKLGRKYRLNVTIASIVIGGIAILAAPGNYGLRMLSIFIPGLDVVGSSDQRRELLERSLIVTARNPWGIGIGNFQIVGVHNLHTHNAFTQVSSEIGILGLIAYLIFMVSPFRKLAAIERKHFDEDKQDWFYYLAIGLQASIIGYMVSSFFASVAYNWFIYYLIAYAVAFRRIYSAENNGERLMVNGE
ncbi:MAG: O-antigen ligase family protein [Pyrinomonadaceae bacterium]